MHKTEWASNEKMKISLLGIWVLFMPLLYEPYDDDAHSFGSRMSC